MPPLTGDPASHSLESLSNGTTGSCLCGSVTISIHQDLSSPAGHTCHCYNCRKFTGSAFATLLLIPVDKVEVFDQKSMLKTYVDMDTGTGDTVSRSWCSNCGCNVGNIPAKDSAYKTAFLQMGLFPRIPVPVKELFTAHRHEWVGPVEGATQHEFLPRSFEEIARRKGQSS